MGQNQGKEQQHGSTPSKSKSKTVKHRNSTSQAETENGGFTLPWDLRDGGIGNGPAVPSHGEDGNVNGQYDLQYI